MRRLDARGQSAVEFVLVAPLLFLIFFAILQLAYMGLTAMAVQRSAMAIAREASISSDQVVEPAKSLRTTAQHLVALYPLVALNRNATSAVLLCTRYEISHDLHSVTATVHYPMPIWVPGAGRWFGETLIPPFDLNGMDSARPIREIVRLFGISAPDIPFDGIRLPFVRWMDFSATVFRESAVER